MNIYTFIQKLRPYTLLVSITFGFLIFCLFHYVPEAQVLKPIAYFVSDALPGVLFVILFFAFCKIDFKQMHPRKWHYLCVALQVGLATLLALSLQYPMEPTYAIFLEGVIVCIITPTAASASVITGRLGGNESAITTYIIMSNIAASIFVPLLFPLFSNVSQRSFLDDFLVILQMVGPVLLCPLVLAICIKLFFKKLHTYIIAHTKDIGFYLWAFIILVMSAKTFANIAASTCSSFEISLMALIGLLCTILQFAFGKGIGQLEIQRISAGQGLGQKNMLFGIWVALSYLSPTVAIIPGTYIIWQNLMNAWQMWNREKLLKEWKTTNTIPYQE